MAIYKCKMCGGQLEVRDGDSICTCDYCGTNQTIPKVSDVNIQNLFNRANFLRIKSEFDKAAELYEKIIQNNSEEAEAYWGLILCKYGIEYVEDPKTFKRIPTCHRASYDTVVSDEDYKNAIAFADLSQKTIYEEEAKTIDEIQRGIIELAQKDNPYDVFICYKETDENGKRTQDSVIANDIYYQLKQEGFKVFYAAITLEDVLGQDYEAHIFSALNTARVMLSIGTKPEYFNSVWVKNEWSRFLKIMKTDRTKLLIPCYKDMDPYELPEEFGHFQAQDMSKIGFISDVVRGIKKIICKQEEQIISNENTLKKQDITSANIIALLKRGEMAIEDLEWDKADNFYEEVLNLDAECADAYIGKLLVKLKKQSVDELADYYYSLFSTCDSEKKVGCLVDENYIDEKKKKYTVKGYLEESEIELIYKFDGFYDSIVVGAEKNKKESLDSLGEEKLFIRAKKYANSTLTKQLDSVIVELEDKWDSFISKEKEKDSLRKEQINNNCNTFKNNADDLLQKRYEEAIDFREYDLEIFRKNKILKDEKKEIQIQLEELLLKQKSFENNAIQKMNDCRIKRDVKQPFEIEYERQIVIIAELENKKDKCGIFKKKEKKEIQDRIDNIEKPRLEQLKKQIEVDKPKMIEDLNNQINVIKKDINDYRDKIRITNKRLAEINKEIEDLNQQKKRTFVNKKDSIIKLISVIKGYKNNKYGGI